MPHPRWNDEYWLLLMQLYLKKPVGLKPLYSRAMVAMSLELHIPPQYLHQQMFRLRSLDTPRLERLWNEYSKRPQKLARVVKMLRQRPEFNADAGFFEGVAMNETFECDFRPIAEDEKLTPVMLIMVLNLYFQLTPNTMVEQTPEVKELAQLIKLTPQNIIHLMHIYQMCDPYLKVQPNPDEPLLRPCQNIWDRYGGENTQPLEAMALQLRAYFK